MYGSLGTRSMVYQNEGGGLQFLPLWSASINGPYKPQWIDELGNFRLFDGDIFGDYIPLTGSDQVQGSITPQQNNTIDLGQPNYRYAHIYATYVTSSYYYGDTVIATNVTASDANLIHVYSTNISSSALTASNAQINNIYSNVITSSVINSTLYDTSSTAKYGGFAYFDQNTQQLVSGGDLYDLPSWEVESASIDARFKDHNHYITQSIMVGQTPSGTTDSTEMFLRGNDGNDTNPQWSYITPNYIKSNSDLTALTGPGVLVIDNSSGYTSGSWVTSSLSSTDTKVLGVKVNENTLSFFTVDDTLGIVTVPHGGTGQDNLTKYAVLLGNATDPIQFASPNDSGKALISNGPNAFPSFGTVPVNGGGTGLTTIGLGQLIYGTNSETYTTLSIGTTGQVLQVNNNVPTWSNMHTLHAQIGYDVYNYNPTSSDISFTASALIHSHSANDIVSGQLAIARIPVGTSYDTVAAGNHVHEDLNITIGSSSYTYNGGTEVNVDITSEDIMSAIDLVPVQKGGTGLNTNSKGDLFVGKGGTATDMYIVSPSSANSGMALISYGSGNYPNYGVLGIAGGGTGITGYTKGNIIYADNTDSLTTLPIGGQNYVLTVGSNNTPTWSKSVLSSSYADSAKTASYVKNAETASYVKNAQTASYIKLAESASYAITTDTAISSSYAVYASNSFYSTYANATERLLTPFKISIHGAATAEAQYVDGQTDVQLNVYELDAHYLYGLAPIEVIPTGSYATFTASTFKGNIVGTASYASASKTAGTASYAPDYIPLAGTTGLTGDIIPTVNNSVNLGNETHSYANVYATTFHGDVVGTSSWATHALNANYADRAGSAQTADTASKTAKTLTITSSVGTEIPNTTFNGSVDRTIYINNGTLQPVSQSSNNQSIQISHSNHDYRNHTVYIYTGNTSLTKSAVTLPNSSTELQNIKVGDKITIKAATAKDTYQFTIASGSTTNHIYNRKMQASTAAITSSYGIDIVFTCVASGSNNLTWIYEKIPVTFIE